MRRASKIALGLIAAVAAVAVAGVAGLALTFDPNAEKTRITDAVRRATGRDLVLAGPLRFSLGPSPTFEAQDVSFANRAGGTRPQMAVVTTVRARLALLPLLTGHVEIATITLIRPDILLETDGQGIGNWQVQRPAASGPRADEPAAPRQARAPIVVRQVIVENGRLTWHDGRTGFTEVADLPHAQVEVGDDATHVLVDAQIGGIAGHLHAVLGTPDQLMGAAAGPFQVKGTVQFGDGTLELDGVTQFPVAEHGYQGLVHAVVPDLAAFGPALHTALLPPLHDVRIDATMAGPPATPVVTAASLHVGASDLSRYLPAAALTQLDLTVSESQQARLEAEGTLGQSQWRLATGLVRSGGGVALRALVLQSAVADLQGDVAFAYKPRPSVGGTLVSHHVDLDQIPLLSRAPAATPGPAPASAAPPAPVTRPPSPSGQAFSTTPLRWDQLQRVDVDVQLTVDALRFAGAEYLSTTAHLALRDGALRLTPVSMQAPEGHIAGTLTADASQRPPSASLELHSPAFALDPLALALGLPGGSDARVEVDVALQSAGQSPHDLAAGLNGHAGLAMVDGDVSNAALAAAMGPVTRMASIALEPNGRSHVRCLALRLDAAQGLVTVAALKLDTSRLALDGSGSLNLADETLALRLRPTVRIGGVGGMAPIRVDGSFTHPTAALDTLGQAGRVGVVIGGLAPDVDTCTAQLTAARDGHSGRLPADAPAKSVKPADLLRSFLR